MTLESIKEYYLLTCFRKYKNVLNYPTIYLKSVYQGMLLIETIIHFINVFGIPDDQSKGKYRDFRTC